MHNCLTCKYKPLEATQEPCSKCGEGFTEWKWDNDPSWNKNEGEG